MKRARSFVLNLFGGVLALGCTSEPTGNDTQSSTTATTSPTGGEQSGSVTSAPGSATDETVGDSAPTMATATTTASTTTDSSSTGEGCQFLNCDDMGTGGECDNFAQDCPEGQKCAAWADDSNAWNAVKCVDVTGTDKPGEPCTGDLRSLSGMDSCIEGAMCWDYWNDEGVGTCIAQCTGSVEAPICPNNSPCTIGQRGIPNLCLSVCDPLLQNCEGAGLCIPTGDNWVCVVDAGGEQGQANDPCEFANVCDPGLVCLDPTTVGAGCDPAAGGCCTPFCAFPDGACPNPDQSCTQWFDPAMLPENDPQLDIGFCAVPA